MQSTLINFTDLTDKSSLPAGWCVMAIEDGDQVLHLGMAPNAWHRYSYLKQMAERGGEIAHLMNAGRRLRVWPQDSALSALIAYKALNQELYPSMQSAFMPWKHYVYLALNPYQYPFIRIASDTQDDWFYIGPFRSRFFLVDVIDTYGRILKLPRCETGSWPCEKLDQGICSGYCRSLDGENSQSDYGLEKLEALLNESFVHPDNGILELIKKEHDRYFDDLEFEKAELLKDEIELLEDYRDWLIFLYSAPELYWEDEDLIVERGKIRRCRYQGKDYLFAPDITQYRENERLALNLDCVDEARILFEHYKKIKKV